MSFTPARLAYSNLLLGSGVVITSSGDATGYPATNLANPARWKKWRSTTTTGDQWVQFDLGSTQAFQLLAVTDVLLHTNGGTLKAQANASAVWTSPTVNDTISPLPSPDLTHVLADWLSSVQTLRYVRFLFSNVGASNSYVEIGAAFCGPYFQAAKSVAPGVKLLRTDQSVPVHAIGGQRSTVVRAKAHEFQGTFALQSSSDRESFRAAFDANGVALPCVFGLVPGTPSLTFYGTLAAQFEVDHRPKTPDNWDVVIDFLEDVA